MNARVLLSNKEKRKSFLEDYDLDRNELLVETIDRYAHDHAVLVNPTCSDALVVAKQNPELRGEGERMFTDLRTIYVTRVADAVKILMSQSGQMDITPSRCFVLRQGS
ncbi:MAG: hypothetical protein KY455_04895 [Euryarchaeota archaeon]|nr:hypothetical protein [Euryarchaeota archaeon]